MTLRRLAARGVYWTALENWGYQIATLVVFAFLARLVAPEAFVLIALATVFTSVLKIAADQGMADAIIQRPDIDDEHINGAFWTSVTLGVVLTALLGAASPVIATLFGDPALGPVLAALSTSTRFRPRWSSALKSPPAAPRPFTVRTLSPALSISS